MFEGIVTTKKYSAKQEIDGSWTKLDLISQATVKNSMTASGIMRMLGGRMFTDGLHPVVHIYSHNEPISPAVATVSGYLATATPLGTMSTIGDVAQQYIMHSVTGRLDPPVTARTIRTIGLGAAADTSTPSFAVRLTNPIVQGTAQIVEITYTIVARRANNTTIAAVGSTVSKVSNNSWSALFDRLYGEETVAEPAATFNDITFLQTPEDFTTATNLSGRNSLAENLGLDQANRTTKTEAGVAAATTTTVYSDEAAVQLTLDVPTTEAIGFNFNKSLVSIANGTYKTHLYVNDLGYSGTPVYTAQNLYQHDVTSVKPYPTLSEPLATGTGMIAVDVPTSGISMKFPTYMNAVLMDSGDIGTCHYYLAVRFTQGFGGNDVANEFAYRLPALDILASDVPVNTYDSSQLAYTGRAVLAPFVTTDTSQGFPLNAFSLRHSKIAGSTYVGNSQQSDAIAIVSPFSFNVVANLGTSVYQLDSSTVPSFVPELIRSVATVTISGLARTFLADANKGLWRINEVLVGETYSPGIPFLAAVPIVDATKCYAVATRELAGENTVFAAFEGGLARSLNGGNTWQVYTATGSEPGALTLSGSAVTSDWTLVSAIIAGPTDVGSGASTIAIVLTDDTIEFVDIDNSSAVMTDSVSIPGVATNSSTTAFAVQHRCAYFPTTASGVPSVQQWVFGTATTVHSVEYTVGVSAAAVVDAPADLIGDVVQSRMFEFVDETRADYGMVMYDTVSTSAVLVDASFAIVANFDTSYTATTDGLAQLTNASCRPYRHMYLSLLPHPVLFNPFANADFDGGTAKHLVWRPYEWTGSEWQLITDSRFPVTGGPYTFDGRLVHDTSEPLFSTGPYGILQDIPAGIEVIFDPDIGAIPFTADEYYTWTLSSGIQKDEYTAFTHTVAQSFYRSEPVTGATAVLQTAPDMINRPVAFVTNNQDTHWFSQGGTVSSINSATARFIRSELTTPDEDQSWSVKFKVTQLASTGSFDVGIAREDLPTTGTLATLLPVRIHFTGTTYEVFVGAVSAYAATALVADDEFTIAVVQPAGTFSISVNGTPLVLTEPDTLPVALTTTKTAVGLYALDNQNRYAYDFKVATWPAATVGGDISYYAINVSGNNITTDPLFVSVESRVIPPSLVIDGIDIITSISSDPGTILAVAAATDEIKLLPKSGLLMVNDVPTIGSAVISCVAYKK